MSRTFGVEGVVTWDGIGGSDGRGVEFGHGGSLYGVGAGEGGRGHVRICWAVGTGTWG